MWVIHIINALAGERISIVKDYPGVTETEYMPMLHGLIHNLQ